MTKDEMLNMLLGLAEKARKNGDIDKAKDIYQRIIKNSPDSNQALIAEDALDTLESLSKPSKAPSKKLSASAKNAMEYVYLALGWIIGAWFLISGAALLWNADAFGFVAVAISLFLLPPIRTLAYSITKKKLSVTARILSILALMALGGLLRTPDTQDRQELAQGSSNTEARQIADEAAKRRAEAAQSKQEMLDYHQQKRDEFQKKREEFQANKSLIIASANRALESKDYQAALNIANQYMFSGDQEIKNIVKLVQNARKTQKLLNDLRTIDPKDSKKNKDIYQQLADLNPGNEDYSKKLATYTTIDARRKRIEKQFSSWDGSHYNLERYIEQVMKDPDSYEHVKTVAWDRGDHLIVQTTFRGKNSFGATVLNSIKAKVSLDGDIIAILDD